MAQIAALVNARRDLADISYISRAQAEDEAEVEGLAGGKAAGAAAAAADDLEAAAAPDQAAVPKV